jgi:hypothetical protein
MWKKKALIVTESGTYPRACPFESERHKKDMTHDPIRSTHHMVSAGTIAASNLLSRAKDVGEGIGPPPRSGAFVLSLSYGAGANV